MLDDPAASVQHVSTFSTDQHNQHPMELRDVDRVQPGYLAWWLNQPDSQAALESASRGTGIGYIARPLMERIPVVVPSLDQQRRIAETMRLWRQQQSIQARLDQKREQLIHATCREAINVNREDQVASEVGQAFLPDTSQPGMADILGKISEVGQAFLPDTRSYGEKSARNG